MLDQLEKQNGQLQNLLLIGWVVKCYANGHLTESLARHEV